jgi:cytochrome bd-type quinol oxidase subunit 2
MTDRNVADRAEYLSRRRARMLPVLAILLLVQQGSFFTDHPAADRPVDQLKISAWLVLSAVILLALWTGGSWLQPKRVRELLNDEATQVHRTQAFRVAFLASMIGCIFLYFLTMFSRVETREAIHIILTIGLSAALVSFGVLERRALRDHSGDG